MISDLERAKNKIAKHPHTIDPITGCKLAETCVKDHRYTEIKFNRKRIYLHRLVAFVYHGLDLDDEKQMALHIRECPNKHCFNELHIYVGNAKENADDRSAIGNHPNQLKETCKYGHPLDWLRKDTKSGKYYRACSTCKANKNKKYREKVKL